MKMEGKLENNEDSSLRIESHPKANEEMLKKKMEFEEDSDSNFL